MDAPIEISGTFEVRDFWRFRIYHGLRFIWPVIVFLVVAGVAGLGLVLFSATQEKASLVQLTALPVLWAILIVAPQFWAAKRHFKTQTYLQKPVTWQFNTDGMHARTAVSEADVAWKAFLKARETGTLFVLYTGSNLANLIPKRFFHSAAELDAFRAWIAAGIAPKTLRAPGFWAKWW